MDVSKVSSEDDRKPLLHSQASVPSYTSQSQSLDNNSSLTNANDEQSLLPTTTNDNITVKEEKSILTWKVLKNVILSILAIVATVVFVKGFIDADDAEVQASLILLFSHLSFINELFSHSKPNALLQKGGMPQPTLPHPHII